MAGIRVVMITRYVSHSELVSAMRRARSSDSVRSRATSCSSRPRALTVSAPSNDSWATPVTLPICFWMPSHAG